MLKKQIKLIIRGCYIFGSFCISFAMILTMINFPASAQTSEAAVLVFDTMCMGGCTQITAVVRNNGQSDMTGSTTYEVQFHNGSAWEIKATGTIPLLLVNQSYTLSYNPNNIGGLYRFKVYQPAGASGPGVIYSGACKFDCTIPTTVTPEPTTVTPEPTTVTPEPTTVTPEPTTVTPEPTTVTPEPTTVTPEPTTVTPEPTTVTPEPTTVTPEPTTVTPEPTTVTPEPTTVTPEPTTVTPEPTTVTPEPTTETPGPTPGEPTPTPGEPTPTPGEPTPTPGEPTPTPGESTATTVPPNPTSVVTLAPPASSDSSPILIPVTGRDLSSNKTQELFKSILFNLGLGILGIGLVLQGIFRKNR